MNPRMGSDIDCANLVKLFEQLHFRTVVQKELTGKVMFCSIVRHNLFIDLLFLRYSMSFNVRSMI